MTTLTQTAPARSRLFQLIALGFAHPVAAFHRLLLDGSYSRALAVASSEADTGGHFVHAERQSFADFEARYIELFQMGRRGKPLVSLNAGDHASINQGESRPDFLLEYAGWYRHFGLKTDDSDQANELPDHLVCQLEFMAWLAHLEINAAQEQELLRGYQLAQRDFLERHLQPFLEELVSGLQRVSGPADNPFFLSLAALALETAASLTTELAPTAHNIDPADDRDETDNIAAVNLWG